MLFTLAYIYRWKGGRATKLEGSDHIPVYAILTDVPNLHVHNTPSLAVRYIPEVRGWQPTIGEGTILHSFNKLFSSIICVIKIAIDLNMLHTKRNKNVDRSTQWIRHGLLSKRHYFFFSIWLRLQHCFQIQKCVMQWSYLCNTWIAYSAGSEHAH